MKYKTLFSSSYSKRTLTDLLDIFELPNNRLLVVSKDTLQKLPEFPGKYIYVFNSKDVFLGVSIIYSVVIVYAREKEVKKSEAELMNEVFG